MMSQYGQRFHLHDAPVTDMVTQRSVPATNWLISSNC